MNKDQGKPSEKIVRKIIHPENWMEEELSIQGLKEVIDSLHQRLVSAEAEIKALKKLTLPSHDNLICDHVTSRCDECEPPTQEATKQECEHDRGDCNWHNSTATQMVIASKFYNPKCPFCPTPEPRKLAEILCDAQTYPKNNVEYKKMAEAVVKEVERVISNYKYSKSDAENYLEGLKQYLRKVLL